MPYQEYFKSSSESLIIVDRGGRIVEANPRAGETFGYAQDELVGQPVETLLPQRLRQLHRSHVSRFFAAPRTRAMGQGMNLVARRKDGDEFPVEVSLTYAHGTSRGDLVVAAVIDISQRLALEREARQAETLTSLGALAAGIAHDLNNPLQVIRSLSEFLLDSPDSTPASEMRDDLAAIRRQVERAGKIVDEFLELSRQREKILAPFDLNGLVERALLLVGGQMRKGGIRVETALEENLPEIMGDATALERVLINLLTNAYDAMRDGGDAVTIASGAVSERPGWIYLSVTDDGPGIGAEALGRIFDLLYTTKSGGTGLGLWLSRRIVQEHRGKLEVKSGPGAGAVFTITLPALS
jgi:PAS domain S-box-containing protein